MQNIIITIAIILWPTSTVQIEDLNCEYLFFSGQGTEIQNTICADEFEKINRDTLQWKKEALNNRGIY